MSHDVAILGGGFAGSILARCLAAEGAKVLLVDRDRHPRFALGESTTPLANFALERIAARYGLDDLQALAAHGRWIEHFPALRRGLKRGFTFYAHAPDEPFRDGPGNPQRALFAASPDARVADTHWLRADVDHHLLWAAEEAGLDVRTETEVVDLEIGGIGQGIVITLDGGKGRERVRADRVVDATGRAGVVARTLGLAGPSPLPFRTHLVAAHVELPPGEPDAATCGESAEHDPYPAGRAAVHHLLDEGWMYVLPFDADPEGRRVASVGLVLREGGASKGAWHLDPGASKGAWHPVARQILNRYPTLAARFPESLRVVEPFRVQSDLAFRRTRAAGDRWLLLPGAFSFVDPLFSTGIAWSLLGVERAVDVLCGGADPAGYADQLDREADQMTRLVEAAWRAMDRRPGLRAGLDPATATRRSFDDFVAVASIYFAAVSYAESLRRLEDVVDRSAAWDGFLGAGDEIVERVTHETVGALRLGDEPEAAPRAEGALRRGVVQALAERDVAGLDQPRAGNLFPLDLDLLVERSHRLGLDRDHVRARLDRLRGVDTK